MDRRTFLTTPLLLLPLPSLATIRSKEKGKVRRLILMVGQSNMSGRGVLSEVPTYPNASRIFMYGNDDAWKPGAEPTDSSIGEIDTISIDTNAGASIGMSFANRLCDLFPDDEVGLIQASKGATKIYQWRRASTRSSLHGNAIARMWAAHHSSPVQAEISGILWWQGEEDAILQTDASVYQINFANTIAEMRMSLQNLSLPFAYARLNNLNPSNSSRPYWNDIRQVQNDTTIERAVMVSTDGVPYQSDNVHCTTAGYQTIGIRFADAIAPLL